jgi:hypothetical protein
MIETAIQKRDRIALALIEKLDESGTNPVAWLLDQITTTGDLQWEHARNKLMRMLPFADRHPEAVDLVLTAAAADLAHAGKAHAVGRHSTTYLRPGEAPAPAPKTMWDIDPNAGEGDRPAQKPQKPAPTRSTAEIVAQVAARDLRAARQERVTARRDRNAATLQQFRNTMRTNLPHTLRRKGN